MPPPAPSTKSKATSSEPLPSMQIAEILSDLTSLRVCSPTAALSLVSARPSPSPIPSTSSAQYQYQSHPKPSNSATPDSVSDPDLQRAKDIVDLHYAVKVGHQRGELDRGLYEAREAVRRAVGG